jgi:hypothetical protein
LIVKSTNRMLVGDLRDQDYLRRLARYERGLRAYDAAVAAGTDPRGLEIPEKPQPPKLSAHELNALSGAVRTWSQCKEIEVEELLKEVNETNQKLLRSSRRRSARTAVPRRRAGRTPGLVPKPLCQRIDIDSLEGTTMFNEIPLDELPSVARARLPALYEQARDALASCARTDDATGGRIGPRRWPATQSRPMTRLSRTWRCGSRPERSAAAGSCLTRCSARRRAEDPQKITCPTRGTFPCERRQKAPVCLERGSARLCNWRAFRKGSRSSRGIR